MSSTVQHEGPILLFDGVCNLCTGAVRFVIERDPQREFRFASLQSPTAEMLLADDMPERGRLDSLVLIDRGRVYRKSTAVLLTARRLRAPWSLLSILLLVPRPLRDAVYDWIGSRRYRMFGKREACWQPGAELCDWFLERDRE